MQRAHLLKNWNTSGPVRTRLFACSGGFKVVKEGPLNSSILEREACALNELKHESGLPRLLSYKEGKLERSYLPGITLKNLRRHGWVAPAQRAAWLQRLADLLRRIHRTGWWHGDVSPSNVLIDSENQVFLLDWGGPDWGTPPYRKPGLQGEEADWAAWSTLREELLAGADPEPADRPRLRGRQQERKALQAAWQETPFRDGTWIGVSAPSGGGKTALLQELLWTTPNRAWGRGTTLSTPVSYVLFQSVVRGWELTPEDLGEARWRAFARTFPGAFQVPETEGGLPLSPMLMGEIWLDLLRKRCACSPMLLLLDDIQWMDSSSQAILEILSQRPIAGLMVVLAWRSDQFQLPNSIRLSRQLPLQPLQPEEVLDWAQAENVSLAAGPAQELVRWTRGNPLLISEWLRRPDRPDFSPKVGFLLRDRLERVPTEYLPILRRAALVGSEFDQTGLANSPALDWAERNQLILPGGRFAHDQIRETLLDGMDESSKRQIHAELAEHYAHDYHRSAFHWLHSGQPLRASGPALQAARFDRDRSLWSSAAEYYRTYCRVEPVRAVILELARVLEMLGQFDEAVDWLRACAPTAEAKIVEGELHRSAGRYLLANACGVEASRLLASEPSEQRGPLVVALLQLHLSASYSYGKLWRALLQFLVNFPTVLNYLRSNPVAEANLVICLGYIFPRRKLAFLRHQALKRGRSCGDELIRGRVSARLFMYHIKKPNAGSLERMYEALADLFEAQGSPWDLMICLMVSGFCAAVRGQFELLGRIGQRLQLVARQTKNLGLLDVAIHFHSIRSGAQLSARQHEPAGVDLRDDPFKLHRLIAHCQFLIRQGRPGDALGLLDYRIGTVPFEKALVAAWQAQVCRMAAEQVPRRWNARRQSLFQEAERVARQGLALGDWGRLFFFQLRRELSLALAGQDRLPEAQRHMRWSIEEAAKFGAHYEKALSRRAWAEQDWPGAEEEGARAQGILRGLGAWWELTAPASGLPLEDLGEAASHFLETGQAPEVGSAWADPEWWELLRDTRRQADEAHQKATWARRRRAEQAERWGSFLSHGPVEVEVREDETVRLNLPLAHQEIQLCTELLDAHEAYLRTLGPPALKECLSTLPGLSMDWPEQVARPADIPWQRLGGWARAALIGVVRELHFNQLKHGKRHHLSLEIRILQDTLEMETTTCEAAAVAASPAARRSFGLESMRFRVALAGGQLQLGSDFSARLHLPLESS